MRAFWFGPLALLALSACGASQHITPSTFTQCGAPRPQVCTMEYAPVCASLATGGEREFSSACNACANETAVSYLPGGCTTEESQ